MSMQALEATITALVAPGRGILAADKSTGTIEKRFNGVNVPCTAETRLLPGRRTISVRTPVTRPSSPSRRYTGGCRTAVRTTPTNGSRCVREGRRISGAAEGVTECQLWHRPR